MRAESRPLFHHGRQWHLYLVTAGVAIVLLAALVAVVLAIAATVQPPETLFTGPFRWISTMNAA